MSEQDIEQIEEVETHEEVNTDLSTFSGGNETMDRLQKPLMFVGIGLIVVVLGYIGYNKFIWEPANEESLEAVWYGERSLIDDENFVQAINGDSLQHKGLKYVAENYGSYDGGKIAQYDLGIAYLNNGQYAEAIAALEQVDFDDEMVSTVALGAMGDAHLELGDITAAFNHYEMAYQNSDNELTAPIYMLKAAYAKELEKKFDDAVKIYQELIEKYPDSPEIESAKKYIEMAKKGVSAVN